jgi:hypothetical protein
MFLNKKHINGLSSDSADTKDVEQNTLDIASLQTQVADNTNNLVNTPSFTQSGIGFGTSPGTLVPNTSFLGSWTNIASRPPVSYAVVNLGAQKLILLRGYVGRFLLTGAFIRRPINSPLQTTTLLTLPAIARPQFLIELSTVGYNTVKEEIENSDNFNDVPKGVRAYVMIIPDGRVQLVGSLSESEMEVVSLNNISFLTS